MIVIHFRYLDISLSMIVGNNKSLYFQSPDNRVVAVKLSTDTNYSYYHGECFFSIGRKFSQCKGRETIFTFSFDCLFFVSSVFILFRFCFLCFFDLDSESVLKKIDKKIIYGKFLFFLFFLKPIRH